MGTDSSIAAIPSDTVYPDILFGHTDTVPCSAMPIDSAFIGGTVHLSGTASAIADKYLIQNSCRETADRTVTGILATIMAMLGILLLRQFVNLVPSLTGCLIRWKENLNLENSMQLNLSRRRIFMFLTIPFCMIAASYRLYDPVFLQGLPLLYRIPATAGILAIYLIIRKFIAWYMKNRQTSTKSYNAAVNIFYTFFIITAIVTIFTGSILSVTNIAPDAIRTVLLYEIAFFYLILIIRKFQIFQNYCSLFSAILYLCALEFLPTGILAATAIFL